MKPFNLIVLLGVFVQLFGYEVKMRVVDEKGEPVTGAMTKIIFIDNASERVDVGVSGPDGRFSSRGRGTNSVMLKASKDGHYQARVEGLSKDTDHDIEVVLPRIINPISLFAMRINTAHRRPGDEMTFPVHNQWVGFDLEVADWVVPHGKGKVSDFLLRFTNDFKGFRSSRRTLDERIEIHKRLLSFSKEEWTEDKFKIHSGKWDGLVEMSFPGEGEGILEVKRFIDYSPMKLPHLAPDDGYSFTWKRTVNNYIHSGTPNPLDRVGFFLRTRVKKDQQGRIISANYAKFVGTMNVIANTGEVEFCYYFNPTPNDRNLEFDPKQNLFPKDKAGANVYDP